MSSATAVLMSKLVGKHRCPRTEVIFQTVVDRVDSFLLASSFFDHPVFVSSPTSTNTKSFEFVFCEEIGNLNCISTCGLIIDSFENQAGSDGVGLVLNA